MQDIKAHSPAIINISITTADDKLCKILEPNVSLSSERFEALNTLSAKGVFCGVLMSPILPFINDTEENIVNILRMSKEAGAKFVYSYLGMTLRQGNREYFYNKLDEHLLGVKDKYIKQYGFRYNCPSPNAKKLWGIYATECERLGLVYDMKAIIANYKMDYKSPQLTLF